jgi:hypothetical protein
MKRGYNDYDDILTKQYKKEQNEKLNVRIRNAKSIINNKSPKSYNVFHKRVNKSHGKDEISKNNSIIF